MFLSYQKTATGQNLVKLRSFFYNAVVLIVTGSIAYDYLMGFPGNFSDHILPKHANNINLSFLVNSFAKRRGGTAGNISYTLGLLHAPHKLFAYVGSDFEEYRAVFEKLKIDLDGLLVAKDDHTSTAFAMADKSQNQIWGFYNGAGALNETLKLKKIANKQDFVFIGPQGKSSLSFIKQCVDLDIPYMFDPGFLLPVITNEELAHGLKHAAFITSNEYERELMQSRIKNWDELTAYKTVITTFGEKGATITIDNDVYKIGSAKAKRVETTAGAGDAWRGGFLAGLERGFDLQTSGQMGAVASSFAVEHVGTQEHFYTKSDFVKRYKDAFNSKFSLA